MKKTKIKKGKAVKITKGKGKSFERDCDFAMVVYSPDSDVVEEVEKMKSAKSK